MPQSCPPDGGVLPGDAKPRADGSTMRTCRRSSVWSSDAEAEEAAEQKGDAAADRDEPGDAPSAGGGAPAACRPMACAAACFARTTLLACCRAFLALFLLAFLDDDSATAAAAAVVVVAASSRAAASSTSAWTLDGLSPRAVKLGLDPMSPSSSGLPKDVVAAAALATFDDADGEEAGEVLVEFWVRSAAARTALVVAAVAAALDPALALALVVVVVPVPEAALDVLVAVTGTTRPDLYWMIILGPASSAGAGEEAEAASFLSTAAAASFFFWLLPST